MTRLFSLAVAFCAALSAMAQISIVSSDMPKANDTFTYVTMDPTGVLSQINKKGANQFWQMAESPVKVTSLVEYKSSLKTPYAFYFFNTVGQKVADSIGLSQFKLEDVYQFYSTNSNSYRIEGMGFKISLAPAPLAGNYQTEDKVYVFPLEYNDYDSTPFKVKISIPFIGSYIQSGYRVTQVIGHGKIVVVNDTFDCLQVRSDIIGADTIETQFTKFGFPSHRVEYKWLAKEYHAPVAEVNGTEVAGQFVPTQARYMNLEAKQDTSGNGGGGSTSVPDIIYNDELSIYPNPAQHFIYKTRMVKSVEAWNSFGQPVSIEWNRDKGSFNWTSGVYFLKVKRTDGKTEIVRLVVAH